MTLVELLRQRAIGEPEGCAFTYLSDGGNEETSLSYLELDRRARRTAAMLQAQVEPGTRVCLFYPPGLEYIEALFGCFYAGMIAVPGYPPRSRRRLHRLEALVEDPERVVAMCPARVMSLMRPSLDAAPESIRNLPWILSDRQNGPDEDSWSAPDVKTGSVALVQYTSGSTAGARGVMLTHENLLHNLDQIRCRFGVSRQSRGVIWLPPYHDMGLIGGILQPVFTGFPCTLMAPTAFLQRPFRWLEAISRYRGTASGGPNFAYELCVRKIPPAEREKLDLSSWEVAFNGAEPVRPETMERFTGAFAGCGFRRRAFHPCYGLAEAGLMVTSGWPLAGPVVEAIRSDALTQDRVETGGATLQITGCGSAVSETSVRIVDPRSCEERAPDRIGEIWVCGPSVASGYWDRPEETAAVFHGQLAEDPERKAYLRTGDLGYLCNGELFVTGRLKDLIILGGANYNPHEIEAAVEGSHVALRRGSVAAFGVAADGSERLVIVHEIEPRTEYRIAEVAAAVRRAVSDRNGLEVGALVLLKAGTIPKTSSGKIRRGACREAYLGGELEVVSEWQPPALIPDEPTQPRTETEIREWLVAQLSSRLAIDSIDVRRPFSEYGLDSTEAVSLALTMETWLGRPVPPILVWDYPTVEAMARYLCGKPAARPDQAVDSMSDPHEPLAVIGIACRFPGADTPGDFWTLLRNGQSAITGIPRDRASLSQLQSASGADEGARWGGFLNNIALFDPYFFGIAPREAAQMDPQQRLLLEVAWEALADAGCAPEKLAGSRTGIFIGISNADYAREQTRSNGGLPLDMYAGTGNALSIAANRISYLLDAKGPSLSVDTACSSSLVALDLARQSLQHGESTMAIVGGVNLILSPEPSLVLARRQMLASDGKCKVFDAAANGYVRGEGCGVVVVKRLSDALIAGDPIWGVILASTVNQDGRTNGLTAPNGPSQQEAIRQALKGAGVQPGEIGYFEMHGTGTALGDAIEADSLASVFSGIQGGENPCWVGSLKANVGHLEPAAGIASLIKTLLALEKGEIAPQIHLEQINPQIALEKSRLRIPREIQAWRRNSRRRVAALNSFGFGGTNVTVIVAEAPVPRAALADSAPLPGFRRERFWFAERTATPTLPLHNEPLPRPLLGRRLMAAEPIFELRLSLEAMPYLSQHEVGGRVIFPAAGYLEMALQAMMEHYGESAVELTNVLFLEQLWLQAGQPRTVQILLTALDTGRASFRIFSRPAQENNGSGWTLHAKGVAQQLQDTADSDGSLESIRGACPDPLDVGEVYGQFHSRGLDYGECFRGIREMWTGDRQALGRFAVHSSLEALAGDYSVHPTILDACLHVLGPAASSCAGGPWVPSGVERFRWLGGYLIEGWSHARAEIGFLNIRGDVRVFHRDGRAALEILGVELRNTGVGTTAALEPASLKYELRFEPEPLPAVSRRLAGHWLVVAHESAPAAEICEQIAKTGATAGVLPAGAPEFDECLATPELQGVVYLTASAAPDETQRLASHALIVLQALAAARFEPEIWVVTRGAYSVPPQLAQSAVCGLVRTLRLEHPALKCTLIDLDSPGRGWEPLLSELCAGHSGQDAIWRDGVRLSTRIVPAASQSAGSVTIPRTESYCLQCPASGSMESLELKVRTRSAPQAGQVEIRIQAAGLNFSDVMKALGVYPGDNQSLGAECSGIVQRVGEGVTRFQPGDEVMGIAPTSFAPYSCADARLLVRKPRQLRFEEAAGIPIAFLTAAYGLHRLARLRAGERVLIHSASGGVGLAAIQLARRAGAEILATAGSDEKRAFVRGLGVDAVYDSRSLDFVEMIRREGRGVDVVLNSLAGDAMARSLESLAPHGRFLEIGKTDIYQNRNLDLAPFRRAISYFAIDLDRMFRERAEEMHELLVEIAGWFESGELKPLPLRVFPIEQARDAFRHMAQAKHIGKIVLSPTQPDAISGPIFRRDAAYLVTGGLGALGLHVAAWLAGGGAGQIVLLGRSRPSGQASATIAALRSRGVDVVVRQADVGDLAELEGILAGIPDAAPLRGVVHAAGTLADATFGNITAGQMRDVMRPKVSGAWNLHLSTQHLPLDFFVMFSSIGSVLGSPGQGSYSAANCFLDAMAAYRQSLGLPALAVNWGPWAGDGMAAGHTRRLEHLGFHPLEPAEALRALESEVVERRSGQVIVAAGLAHALLREESRPRQEPDAVSVEDRIVQHIARVSGISPDRIDRERSLADLGIDSLTALELVAELEKALRRKLPLTMGAGDLSVTALALQIAQHIGT